MTLRSLIIAIAAIAGGVLLTPALLPSATAAEVARSALPVLERAPGLDGASTWLNSAPLTMSKLRGKVVLVDFWTYSCINCIRTIPYIRAWADKYRDKGLVVVGVHTPEFDFENELTNVNAAMERFKIDFPVAVDSDRRIWRAFSNRYWPAFYLIDANGNIRYRQFGEGDYDKSERAIQALLAENGKDIANLGLVNPVAQGEQMAPPVEAAGSEETYVGYAKASNFRSAEMLKKDVAQSYTVAELALNDWGLFGSWNVKADRGVVRQPGAGIAYRFSARDLHLVLGPGPSRKPVRIQVLIDGRAPGADHGADIDEQGYGVLTQTRLYQLVRQSGKVRERRFEIRFLTEGAEAFAFTFG